MPHYFLAVALSCDETYTVTYVDSSSVDGDRVFLAGLEMHSFFPYAFHQIQHIFRHYFSGYFFRLTLSLLSF